MRINDPDWSPLKGATRSLRNAKQATYIPKQIESQRNRLDIASRFRELQEEERAAGRRDRLVNTILGGAQLAVQAGSAIAQVIEQKELQAAKKWTLEAGQELRTASREAYLAGEYQPVQNEDGTVDFQPPERLKKMYADYEGQIKEQFKFSSKVRGFAEESLRSNLDSAANFGIDNAIVQYAKERDAISDQLLSGAIQDAVSTGSEEAIIRQVHSETWRSKEAQDLRIASATSQAKFGRADSELSAIATKQGMAAALTAFESVKGAFSAEQQSQLSGSIATADKTAYELAEAQATSTYTQLTTDQKDATGKVTQKGYSPAEAIRGIEATITGPDERKMKVIDALRKQQDTTEWDRAYDNFTESSDVLAELKEKRRSYSPGGSEYNRFDGLKGDSLKRVQEMFDRKIESLEADDKGEDGNLGQEMVLGLLAYQKGVAGPDGKTPTAQAAMARQINLIEAGGPAELGLRNIAKIQAGGKPEYEPALEAYGATMNSLIDQQRDPAQRGRLRQIQLETMDMAGAMIGKGETSVDALQKSLNISLDIEFAKNFDKNVKAALDSGVMSTATDPTGARQIAAFKGMAQTGALDDLVYIDANGTQRFTRGAQGFRQMMSKSEEILSDMGIPVKKGSTQFVRQGESDIGADFTTKGADGSTYSLRTDDGKNYYPAKLTDKGWVKIDLPKKATPVAPDVAQTIKTDAAIQGQKDETANHFMGELSSMSGAALQERVMNYLNMEVITTDDLKKAGYRREKGKWIK